MGTTDSNGIYQYAETDTASPFSTLLNLGQQSISTAVASIRARLNALEATPSWAAFTLNSGWAVASGYNTRVLRDGKIVQVEGTRITRSGSDLTVTGGTAAIDHVFMSGTNVIPSGYRPAVQQEFASVIHLGNGEVVPVRVTMTPTGGMSFRSSLAGTLGQGGANILVIPPMSWAAA